MFLFFNGSNLKFFIILFKITLFIIILKIINLFVSFEVITMAIISLVNFIDIMIANYFNFKNHQVDFIELILLKSLLKQ